MNHIGSDYADLAPYLAFIDSHPHLKTVEEKACLAKIETIQMRLLVSCSEFPMFRADLHALLSNQDLSINSDTGQAGIVKISRSLNEDSSEDETGLMEGLFEDLVSALSDVDDPENITPYLESLKLSGNLVNALTQKLRKKHTKMLELEKTWSGLQNMFRTSNYDELKAYHRILKNCNAEDLRDLAKELNVDYTTLCDQSFVIQEFFKAAKDLQTKGIVDWEDRAEIKSIMARIAALDGEMHQIKTYLANHNLALCVNMARKYAKHATGLDLSDLIQEGNLGLMRALDKIDSSRSGRISTYATWWVKQSILRSISNNSRTIRMPTHVESHLNAVKKSKLKLTHLNGGEPTLEEIAEDVGLSVDYLHNLEVSAVHPIMDLHATVEDVDGEGHVQAIENIADADESDIHEEVARDLMKEKIRVVLSEMTERSEKVVRLLFGIGDYDETLTLEEVATITGVTKQAVHKTGTKFITKVKKEIKND